ncbi:MAG: hypothetical protein AB8B53_10045 [Flavobacteriales bacterium]
MKDGELSFVLDKSLRYNRPLYWDTRARDNNNDDQVFDFEKSEITETRSYFKDALLIDQLNSEDCEAPYSEEYLANEGIRLMSEFERILKMIE